MADFFQDSPNFVNPAYASPEQWKAQRDYAEQLMKRSSQDVNRPTGAFANMIDALTGNIYRSAANQSQSQAAQSNANVMAEALRQARGPGGWQSVDPRLIGQLTAVPSGSPEQRSLMQHLIQPQTIESPYKEPAFVSPSAGAQAPMGRYTPGAPYSETAPGASQSGITGPPVAVPSGATPPPLPPPAVPVPSSRNVVGTREGIAKGLYPSQTAIPPAGVAPPGAPAGAVPNFNERFGAAYRGMPQPGGLGALAKTGRDLEFLKASNESQMGLQKQDFEAAAIAPAAQRIMGIMRDDLHSQPLNMGPTAEWKTNFAKTMADNFPGLVSKEESQKIAAQDSFEKSSAQLVGVLSKSGVGTDAQLLTSIKSVPGSHNSREGADALLDMGIQVAAQTQALRRAVAGATSGPEYEARRSAFFADPANRIINPLTRNPIAQDMEQQRNTSTPAGGPVRVSSPEEARKLPKGTPIILPDGRQGRVP